MPIDFGIEWPGLEHAWYVSRTEYREYYSFRVTSGSTVAYENYTFSFTSVNVFDGMYITANVITSFLLCFISVTTCVFGLILLRH